MNIVKIIVKNIVNIIYRFLESTEYPDDVKQSPPIELLFLILRLSYHYESENAILNSKWYKDNLSRRVSQMSRMSFSVYSKQDRMFHIHTFEKILAYYPKIKINTDKDFLKTYRNLMNKSIPTSRRAEA